MNENEKKFFDYLKSIIIEGGNTRTELIGYYETLLQHKDKIQFIINDFDHSMNYSNETDDYYCDGYIIVHTEKGYYYKITFFKDERFWGYCVCSPNDIGYNERHGCCGIGCDWIAPMIDIQKIEYVKRLLFDGYQKDMWALKDKWIEATRQYDIEQVKNRLGYIEKSANQLQTEKSALEHQLRELQMSCSEEEVVHRHD